MKKIRVWIVLLLNIVTLGVYGIFWLINRRSEMVKNYKQDIPHWAWLLAPSMIAVALVVLSIFLLFFGNRTGDNTTSMMLSVLGLGLVAILAIIGITIWWMVKFARAAAYVVNGRMTTAWVVVLYIFTGTLVGLFLQYYFNRAASPADRPNEPAQKPSTKFVVIAVLAILVSLLASSTSNVPKSLEQAKDQSSTQTTDY